MFPLRYFPSTFFNPEYWAKVGAAPAPPPSPNIPGGAIIYSLGVPSSNYPAVIAAYNVSAPVRTSDLNPSLFFYIGQDLSRSSNFTLLLTKPSGAILNVAANVFIGSGQPFTHQGIFQAGFYLVYTFGPGDLDEWGTWTVTAFYTDASGSLQQSGQGTFVIKP